MAGFLLFQCSKEDYAALDPENLCHVVTYDSHPSSRRRQSNRRSVAVTARRAVTPAARLTAVETEMGLPQRPQTSFVGSGGDARPVMFLETCSVYDDSSFESATSSDGSDDDEDEWNSHVSDDGDGQGVVVNVNEMRHH